MSNSICCVAVYHLQNVIFNYRPQWMLYSRFDINRKIFHNTWQFFLWSARTGSVLRTSVSFYQTIRDYNFKFNLIHEILFGRLFHVVMTRAKKEYWLSGRFAWFYSVLPTSALMVLENGPRLLPSTFILINYSLTILPFNTVYFQLLKVPLTTLQSMSLWCPPPSLSNFEPGNRVSRLLDQTFHRQIPPETSNFSVSYDHEQWHGCQMNAVS